MNIDLGGQRAFVTGGGRGIGLATVLALAEAGAHVTFTARSREAVDAVLADSPEGLAIEGLVCDVTDFEAMACALADPVDILVNNAGVIGPIGRMGEVDIGAWAENHRINVLSAFHAIQAALPGLIEKRGVVVNLSSGAARSAMEGWSAYCAGKAALAMITRSLHLEYAEHGIRAIGFAPGLVDTDMQQAIRRSGINPISAVPREQLRPVAEPARAIVWLCSSDANDLAGQELDVRDATLRQRCGLVPL